MKAHEEEVERCRRGSDLLSEKYAVIMKRKEEGLIQARYLAVLNSGYQ
jgi:hypothetical protein